MIKINDYENYILRNTPLNDEELNEVYDYEKIVYYSKIYDEDITSQSVDMLKNSYDNLIAKATLSDEKNQNILDALKRSEQMLDRLEQRKQTLNNNLKLNRQVKEPMSFSAGFTNASIIIFVVFVIGIVASVILLSLS